MPSTDTHVQDDQGMCNAFFPARLLWLADAQRVVAEYGGVKAILPLTAIACEPNTSCLTVAATVCYEEPVWSGLPVRATTENA
jgi:hypothetical protein